MIAMCNILAPQYEETSPEEIWGVASPRLKTQIQVVLGKLVSAKEASWLKIIAKNLFHYF